MRTPIRKGGKYVHDKPDPNVTREKHEKLMAELERLIKVKRPPAIKEVKRLALMGDFSENVAYQMAKGRLRGMNQRILDLEEWLKVAKIIETRPNKNFVQLGNVVTVEVLNKIKKYKILGSSETDPANNIISHNSPLGSVLMGRKVGDIVDFQGSSKIIEYKIIKIE